MGKSGFKRGAVKQFEKDVLAVVSVADAFIKDAQPVTDALIDSANRGIGPGGSQYKPIQEPYKSRKKKEGGQSTKFLWGLRRGGLHMLAKAHFTWKKINNFTVQLIWKGTGKTSDYGKVHNEGEGKMPRREWMHLDAPDTSRAIDDLLGGIIQNRSKAFTKKYGK
jgi:hypothetical protein